MIIIIVCTGAEAAGHGVLAHAAGGVDETHRHAVHEHFEHVPVTVEQRLDGLAPEAARGHVLFYIYLLIY
jgi:hypothetical protein